MASPSTTRIGVNANANNDAAANCGNGSDVRSVCGSSPDGSALKDETLLKLTHMAWMRQRSECGSGNSSPENVKSPRNSEEASIKRYLSENGQSRLFSEKTVSNSNMSTAEDSRGLVRTSNSHVKAYKSRSPTPATENIHVPRIPAEEFDVYANESDNNSETTEGDAMDRDTIVQRRKILVQSLSKSFFRIIKPTSRNFDKFCFVDELSLRQAFDKVFSHHRRRVTKAADLQPSTPNAKSDVSKTRTSLNARAPPFWPQSQNISSNKLNRVCDDAEMGSHGPTRTSFASTAAVPSAINRIEPSALGSQSMKKGIPKRGYILNRRPLAENSPQVSDDGPPANVMDACSEQQKCLRKTLDELNAYRLNNLSYFQCEEAKASPSFVEPFEMDRLNPVPAVPATAPPRPTVVSSSMSNAFDSLSQSNKPPGLTSSANLDIAARSEYVPPLSVTYVSSACSSSTTRVITACSLTNAAPYSTFGAGNNAQVVRSAAVTAVPKEIVGQSWSQLEIRQFSRDRSESNDNFAPLVVNGGDTGAVGMGAHYSTQCDRNDCAKCDQCQLRGAVDTFVSNVSNLPSAASFSNPLQPVFATGLRAISSHSVCDRPAPAAAHSPVNGDLRFRHSAAALGPHRNARFSQPYPSNTSHVVAALPGPLPTNLPGSRVARMSGSALPPSLPEQTSHSPTAIPRSSSTAPNAPKCGLPPAPSNVRISEQCDSDGTNASNVSAYRAPSQPATPSPIAIDQFSSLPSFFGAVDGAPVARSRDSNRRPLAENVFVESATNQSAAIRSPQNPSGVWRSNVSAMSVDSCTAYNGDVFGKGGVVVAAIDGSRPVTDASSVISHPSTASPAQNPSLVVRMLQNAFVPSSDGNGASRQQHSHGTSAAAVARRGPDSLAHSHPSVPAFVPGNRSAVLDGGSNEIFAAAAYGNRDLNRGGLGVGDRSSLDASPRSSIETGARVPAPACGVSLQKWCESYPSSGANLAPSPCVPPAVNRERIAVQQSASQFVANYSNPRVATYSAPTTRCAFDFAAGFSLSQLAGGDLNAFSTGAPHWADSNVKDGNCSSVTQPPSFVTPSVHGPFNSK